MLVNNIATECYPALTKDPKDPRLHEIEPVNEEILHSEEQRAIPNDDGENRGRIISECPKEGNEYHYKEYNCRLG
jgi:hypothetical protein